ncbi:hypothetical protein [Rhodococcus sp. 11-3]|uniref:hypothetical protein n=1 Tax=Rhodococcus sp. 11-3 TaxID=2854796 RepID=UPI00203C6D8E|nr:hypothetical protein [Rhodococcus sp. 11-3]USC16983.1 hypothetical protein KZJ41_09010 [Rhodococcus sp. 11-3]
MDRPPLNLARTAWLNTAKNGCAELTRIEDFCKQVRAIGGLNSTRVGISNNGLSVEIPFDPS